MLGTSPESGDRTSDTATSVSITSGSIFIGKSNHEEGSFTALLKVPTGKVLASPVLENAVIESTLLVIVLAVIS